MKKNGKSLWKHVNVEEIILYDNRRIDNMSTRRNVLKRVQQGTLNVEILFFIITFGMYLVYLFEVSSKADVSIINMFQTFTSVGVVITIVSGLLHFVICGIWLIKNIYQNITGKNSISREYFQELDYLRRHWGEPNIFFVKYIGSIKYFYSSPKMQELVEKKRLDILYDRHSELLGRFNFNEDATEIIRGIVSSIFYTLLAGMIRNMFRNDNDISKQITMIIEVIAVLVTMIIYANRGKICKGQGGSFVYEIDTYELKVFEEKIAKIEDSIEMNNEEYELNRTRQVLYEVILKNRHFFGLNEDNTKDLEKLQTLDISYSGKLGMMYKKEIGVVFPGETENERITIIGQNKELNLLYELLNKYGFRSYD